MDSATQRLRSLKFEAQTFWSEGPDQEEGPMLSDEQVARLLLGAPLRSWPDHEDEPAFAMAGTDESDALEAMRGLLIGIAWAAPIWVLIATTVALV
jgi:hypothetical protein